MVCQRCYEDGYECEYPTTFGCFEGDYDCENGCYECEETDECKYETGETGALIQAFNNMVNDKLISYNPFILKRFEN